MAVEIERAVRKSDLGLNPQSDGKVVRIPVPSLTEERRKDLAKKAHAMAEEARVEVRRYPPRGQRPDQEAVQGQDDLRGRRAARPRRIAEADRQENQGGRRPPEGQGAGDPGGLSLANLLDHRRRRLREAGSGARSRKRSSPWPARCFPGRSTRSLRSAFARIVVAAPPDRIADFERLVGGRARVSRGRRDEGRVGAPGLRGARGRDERRRGIHDAARPVRHAGRDRGGSSARRRRPARRSPPRRSCDTIKRVADGADRRDARPLGALRRPRRPRRFARTSCGGRSRPARMRPTRPRCARGSESPSRSFRFPGSL